MAKANGPGRRRHPSSQPSNRRVGAVVVAAGKSTRMNGVDKVFSPILGVPLVAYSLDQLESFPSVAEIVLVLSPDSLDQGRQLLQLLAVLSGLRVVAHFPGDRGARAE